MPRQSLPKIYKANGAVFIVKPFVIHTHKRLYREKLITYIIFKETSLDVDSLEDCESGKALTKNKIK